MSDACEYLHEILHQLRRYEYPFEASELPRNGVYFVFEKGEIGHHGGRVVRVGTHRGQNQLPGRLREHYEKENKDRSIFRKNIGRALLVRRGEPDSVCKQWDIDLTARSERDRYRDSVDFDVMMRIEREVSEYMRANLTFAVISFAEGDRRLSLEKRLISTISQCDACGPSRQWLGSRSPKIRIRESGLWLVQGLREPPLSRREIEQLLG